VCVCALETLMTNGY